MNDFSTCPVCNGKIKIIENEFCKIRSQLIYNEVEFKQYICENCYHSCTYHDVPLELIYNAENALPTDRELGDYRLEFIKKSLDITKLDGMAIEIGGGPGELAEQVRVACSQSRGLVVDFVDRVSLDSLDFVYSDLNNCERTLPSALDDIGISNKKNVFLLSHVLEHIFDPFAILNVLKKFSNSYFFIEVPDFGVYHDSTVLRYSVNCPDHIHYFNSRSFLTLIQRCGFNVIAFERQSAPLVPALRVLCECSSFENSVFDYNAHLNKVSSSLVDIIESNGINNELYIWGLSSFSAKAIAKIKNPEKFIKVIFDTKYHLETYNGIPVLKDPTELDKVFNQESVFVCGSTFSVVQNAMRKKLQCMYADAKFITVDYE
ncbi:Methyltransferase [Phytobacter diazotrophicus]